MSEGKGAKPLPDLPRVSDVPPSVASSIEAASGITSSIQALVSATPIPAVWLERLLAAVTTLPEGGSLADVLGHVLDTVSELLPEYGLAVTVPPEDERPRVLVLRGSSSDEPPASGALRAFPGRRHERVLPLDGSGASFHVAQDSPSLFGGSMADVAVEARLVERAAGVLAGVLAQGRALEAARAERARLEQLRAQVIQSEKLASLGQIAAGLVHELNNPLTSIVAYADLLRRKAEPGGDPEDIERLRRIGEAADRILRFSRDLVDYARPSHDPPGPVSLPDVLDQSLVFCEHVLSRTGVEVERSYDDALPAVRGIAGELTQVFVNLVTNACHAMPDVGARLQVSASHVGDVVRVTVRDNGHGIEAPLMARIFEPFFTTKREGRGTGLGLSIVRNIVERHGGDVHAESDGETFAMFVVTLPVAR